ncbi:MAG: hypothetical protein JJ899_11245 [Alphaproteobacteria bacterium]|nr:hypothetical protein [Alphaproteobacteria bacterium]
MAGRFALSIAGCIALLALVACQQTTGGAPRSGGGENIFVPPVRAGVAEMNRKLEGEAQNACFITSLIVSDIIRNNPVFKDVSSYSCDSVVSTGKDTWLVEGTLGVGGETLELEADARQFVSETTRRLRAAHGDSGTSWTVDQIRLDGVVIYQADATLRSTITN